MAKDGVKSGHYFDNRLITAAVIEFQATGDITLLQPFTKAFQDLVNGVINTHGLWRFWDRKELESEGFQTILQCLQRYEESQGSSLFSYLSVAIKFRLRNWTRSENRRFGYAESLEDIDPGEAEESRRAWVDMDWKGNARAEKIAKIFERALNSGEINDERDAVRQTMKNAAASEGQVRWVIDQIKESGRVRVL